MRVTTVAPRHCNCNAFLDWVTSEMVPSHFALRIPADTLAGPSC